jgi:hypothetical protein
MGLLQISDLDRVDERRERERARASLCDSVSDGESKINKLKRKKGLYR